MPYLSAIIAAFVLVSPFGAVEGKAVSDEAGLTVEITVEVDKTFEAVLVRPFSSFEELPPTSLVALDADTWGGLVTFPSSEDWSLVFDGLEADGTATRSDAMTLTAIGVDPLVVSGDPAPLPHRGIDTSTWWLIAGMPTALAAPAALAWWAFAPEDDRQKTKDKGQAEDRETES
ncbi:MAG: hypothetical protein M3094_11255 [Actinomycetia bacterium]|nr:hypothetical protein [Actinomycetes bacterium]